MQTQFGREASEQQLTSPFTDRRFQLQCPRIAACQFCESI